MNKHITFFILLLVALVVVPFSCKEIDSDEALEISRPANLDVSAGTWRTIVLTSNNQVAVPAPAAVTSDAYRAELAAVKDAQSKLTKEQRSAIDYWRVGGVLRWNQFFRELVARYNLPPVPNADGTYPIPDAENPFGFPQFPFANPPYAARAYSYVSVAQYEALKAAWYYKFQYNRPRPHVTDNGIQALMGESQLPAYPSEDAVMSGAAAEMLKSLFPAAVEEITLLAAEQRNVALWSGKATASDISSGLALGKSVAALCLARASTDGMRNAIGTPAQWAALITTTEQRGEIPWLSQESPARPPMLPLFGNVRAWSMSTADIVAERPTPPPSTSSEEMAKQLEEVLFYSKNVTRERLAIVHKWADGVGTYTPPGHWNDIAAEYISNAQMSEVRAARSFALLNMAIHDAGVGCWETKYFYFNPRPSQLQPSIKTATGIPNFPAFTSGHSTFSASAATVLSYLFPTEANRFNEMASEASLSRLYGGIHYRVDCEVGLAHGKKIGGYTVTFAQSDGAN